MIQISFHFSFSKVLDDSYYQDQYYCEDLKQFGGGVPSSVDDLDEQ